MSHSGYPPLIEIRYRDGLTDQLVPEAHRVLRIDGRWSARTVRRRMMEQSEQINRARAYGDKPLHPVYADHYVDVRDKEQVQYVMPYVVSNQFEWRFTVPAGTPGAIFQCSAHRLVSRSGYTQHSFEVHGPHGIRGIVQEVRTSGRLSWVRIHDPYSGADFTVEEERPIGRLLDEALEQYVIAHLPTRVG